MKQSLRDVLSSRDADAARQLDRLRREALASELPPASSFLLWRALAAAWMIIAALWFFTPTSLPADPRSAALDRVSRALGTEIARSSTDSEPFSRPGIPWM